MSDFFLNNYAGRYIPRVVSDKWQDANGIAAWLASQGYFSAAPVRLADGNQRATVRGYVVCLNGYVFRA